MTLAERMTQMMDVPWVRIAALASGELAFRPLSAIAFMQVIGVDHDVSRSQVVPHLVAALGIAWAIKLVLYWLVQLPIARFYHAERRGEITDRVARGAASATWSMPMTVAIAWTVGWAASYGVVVYLDARSAVVEASLFICGQAVGAFCTAHALAIWATTRTRRGLDVRARARGLSARLPASTIRGRLIIYATGIGLTASCYVAGIVLAARVHPPGATAVVLAVAIGVGIVLGFGAICGTLIGGHMAQPIDELAQAVAVVADRGSAHNDVTYMGTAMRLHWSILLVRPSEM
jgi:hypothetical protein